MKHNKIKSFFLIIKVPAILSVLIFITGCNNNIQHKTLEIMAADAKSKIKTITVEAFKTISDQGGNYEIIDCRQENDYIKGHIPGAINIPRGLLEFSGEISDRRVTIFVYNYDDDSGALCAETLLKLKYKNVKMIENGWKGWSKTYPETVEAETKAETPEKESSPEEEEEEDSDGCG